MSFFQPLNTQRLCKKYGLVALSFWCLCISTGCTVDFAADNKGCGNGIMEGGESCDGTDFGGATCSDVSSYQHGALLCTDDCKLDLSLCHTCGNGEREGAEQCDGKDLGSITCNDLGYEEGTLDCLDDCTFDESGCSGSPLCGNNIVDHGEECDTGGFDTPECNGGTCTFPQCGDGYPNPEASEECDDGDENSDTEPNTCRTDCTHPVCGDLTADDEYGEECDGEDLSDQTCESLGFTSGELSCDNNCSFNTSTCTGPLWSDITGGVFNMGSNTGESDEMPVHEVSIADFELMVTQVTVEHYRKCVNEDYCTLPTSGANCNWYHSDRNDHPVNCVDWFQAYDYCTWIGGRLPSEAEWEYAARSGGQNIDYTWGNTPATCEYAVMNEGSGAGCGTGSTWPVCSKEAGNTQHGLCDMAGNIREWVQDWYHEDYTGAPVDGSAWESPTGAERVRRGGHFNSPVEELRTTARASGNPDYASPHRGFRCAR